MKEIKRLSVVVLVLGAVILCGLAMSYAAPYSLSGDEIVYITGALQARDHVLPDARMLEGDDYGPYLYPKVMLAWYERLGYYAFKSLVLAVLVLATGIGAYGMFRLLWLPWLPSLALAVVALMPRFAAGLEIFGTFTFRDAIGRQSALPLFFVASGFLIRRFVEKKSLWPVFGIVGMCVFLHPVTVMLFAAASLATLGIMRVRAGTGLMRAIAEVFACGVTFTLGGAYLFIEVFSRLMTSASGAAPNAEYVQAVLTRDVWNFPQGALPWFLHMGIVSALFVLALVAFYKLPRLEAVRRAHAMPHGRVVVAWGICLAAVALTVSIALPGANLYAMEHGWAPYIFQQWSRIAKFYYLGIFTALVPAVYAGWRWYEGSGYRFKKAAAIGLVLAGVASSSVGFEIAQYMIGYPNYDPDYIPQALSHAPGRITAAQYGEACQALAQLGAAPGDEVIAGDFALRYYCRANLYVTLEEGSAYEQLTRGEMVAWYERLQAQRAAFAGASPSKLFAFARSAGARYVVLSNSAANAPFIKSGAQVVVTSRHIVLRVPSGAGTKAALE